MKKQENNMTIKREIGSEFHVCNITEQFCEFFTDWQYFLTGRTALDNIIKDIKKNRNVKTALLPAYCCHSMALPFEDNNIEVSYYDIDLTDSYAIPTEIVDQKFDIIFAINYFGINIETFEEKLKLFASYNKESIIIVDVTHSLFSEKTSFNIADYYFCSLRKWTGLLSGGMALKKDGVLSKPSKGVLEKFVSIRETAVKEKQEYLRNGKGEKFFLSKFAEAENLIEFDYADYIMDSTSLRNFLTLDHKLLKTKRMSNFMYLAENSRVFLEKGLKPIVNNIIDEVPLVFPVIADTEEVRDSIRRHLISHDIYCPVHWPLPSDINCDYKAFDYSKRELSIVCDQRYDLNDMQRIIEVIKEYKLNDNGSY